MFIIKLKIGIRRAGISVINHYHYVIVYETTNPRMEVKYGF